MSDVTTIRTEDDHDQAAMEREKAEAREELEGELRRRAQYIDGLREFADALAADLKIPIPDYTDISFYAVTADAKGELARAAKALPGKVDKSRNEDMLTLTAEFGPITYKLSSTAVCERKQVGTKTVQREIPVEVKTVTEEVPVYEWDCPPLLASDEAA